MMIIRRTIGIEIGKKICLSHIQPHLVQTCFLLSNLSILRFCLTKIFIFMH